MRFRRTAILLGAMSALVSTLLTPGAQASPPSASATYWQKCSPVNDEANRHMGTLCMDVKGAIGTQGVVGIGYWHANGVQKAVDLGITYVGNPNPPLVVYRGVVGAGGNTGTHTRSSHIGSGCVAYPVMWFSSGSGMVRRTGSCVHVF
ncbi:hypothetical protein Q5530_30220 [Saccharothrix sp. BKS2]|uniref:hypothetical protein n=1 Tax=Saccharothrix sp. BKS2 TaxID=3064400 RepID=UPI0039E9D5BA